MSQSRLPVPRGRESRPTPATHGSTTRVNGALPHPQALPRSGFSHGPPLRSLSQAHTSNAPPHCSTPIPPPATSQQQGHMSYSRPHQGPQSQAGPQRFASLPHSQGSVASMPHQPTAGCMSAKPPVHTVFHSNQQYSAPHSSGHPQGLVVPHPQYNPNQPHSQSQMVYSHTLSGHLSRIPHSSSSGLQPPSARAYYVHQVGGTSGLPQPRSYPAYNVSSGLSTFTGASSTRGHVTSTDGSANTFFAR